jgi:hypothetical protein
VPAGGHELGLLEAHPLQIVADHGGHLGDAVVLGADGGLPQPALQVGDVLVGVLIARADRTGRITAGQRFGRSTGTSAGGDTSAPPTT